MRVWSSVPAPLLLGLFSLFGYCRLEIGSEMSSVIDSTYVDASPLRDLTPLFCPSSIAVVGASRKPGSVGNAVIRNLIHGEYEGVIYPIIQKPREFWEFLVLRI